MAKRKTSKKTASKKRVKAGAEAAVEPDDQQIFSTVQWSDLHFELMEDIFGHLSTRQQLKFRKVSPGWNNILCTAGPRLTSALVFRLQDFRALHRFCFKPSKKGWKPDNPKGFLPRLVTPYTKWCILDCKLPTIPLFPDQAGKDYDNTWRTAVQKSMLWETESVRPLHRLLVCHPQITRIVVANVFMELDDLTERAPEWNSFKYLGCGPGIGRGRSITLINWKLLCMKSDNAIVDKPHTESDYNWLSLPTTTMKVEDTGFTGLDEFVPPLIDNVLSAMKQYSEDERTTVQTELKNAYRGVRGALRHKLRMKSFEK